MKKLKRLNNFWDNRDELIYFQLKYDFQIIKESDYK